MPEENKTPTVITPEVPPAVVTPATPDPKVARQEALRELSKELGVNLFEAEGLKKVKEIIDGQKTEQEKLAEKVKTYEAERATWQAEKLNYESKLKASQLGINPELVEDALKLAGNDPTKLEEVIKKYPVFKGSGQIKVGLQDPKQTTPPNGATEAEAYMANDPRYRKYYSKNKK